MVLKDFLISYTILHLKPGKYISLFPQGSEYSPFLHDIMYLYCLALNTTLEQGGDPRNGTLVFSNAKGRVFQGSVCCVGSDILNGHVYVFCVKMNIIPFT